MMSLSQVVGVFTLFVFASCAKQDATFECSGRTMGTTWRAQIVHRDSANLKSVAETLQRRLDELDGIFSNWRSDSPVSRFNDSRSTEWQPVPRELAEAVSFCLDLSAKTDGAFDITAAPLIDLWGFGAKGHITTPPDDEAVLKTKSRCGWRKLAVRVEPPALKKAVPDVEINVCSIAEGYAADELAKMLRGRGTNNFLIEVAGAMVASGVNAQGQTWHVGVQQPDAAQGKSVISMPLQNQAISTSGDYRQFFEHDGKRYSHILDARTGRPITHGLQSVTVIADSAFFADGWDTALLILGPVEGRAVAEKNNVSAMFLTDVE